MNKSEQTGSVNQVLEQFLTPPRKSPSAKEQKLREQAEIFSIPTKTVNLTAYSWGEGATVLLVHGWGGRATQFRSFVQPLVESGYRVLAFDAPAHGKTSGKQTNGFEIAEAIATIGTKESPINSIIAHSLGVASTVFALNKEVFVRKVVCLASMCWLSSSVKRFSQLAELSPQAEHQLYRSMEKKFGEDVWEIFSVDKRVANLHIPALLFHDRYDLESLLSGSEAIAQVWKDSQLIVTEGLGHQMILRDKRVIQQTVKFIKEHNI